jgi:hypothetical protein
MPSTEVPSPPASPADSPLCLRLKHLAVSWGLQQRSCGASWMTEIPVG